MLGEIRTAFEDAVRHTPPPMPDVLLGLVMTGVPGLGGVPGRGLTWDGDASFPRLTVQVWTETLRDGDLAAVLREGFGRVREVWVKIVEGYQEAGLMRADVPAEHVARTLIAAAQGFGAQQALFGAAPVEVLQDGLRALMGMGAPR
ncbi:hypothetical protein QFZ75_006738 [Streptomyces sp. V3I8]|nr:TetR family transcriptional regulator C-terminal domain-containing protein [Streptomyces sp. V3I8]MDQ1040322.1 hypothetical protein [Streptomyces sp. V3I8]